MITNFKIFEREWWLKDKRVKIDDKVNLFKRYGEYHHFIVKYPYYSHDTELEYFVAGSCLCNDDSGRSNDEIFYPIIDRDYNQYRFDRDDKLFINKLKEFCENAYGYKVVDDYFYDYNDIEAANRLIVNIDKAYKDKYGPEYGVFDKK
jgi:hypothetical protein